MQQQQHSAGCLLGCLELLRFFNLDEPKCLVSDLLANNLHAASLLLLPFANDDINIKFTKFGLHVLIELCTFTTYTTANMAGVLYATCCTCCS